MEGQKPTWKDRERVNREIKDKDGNIVYKETPAGDMDYDMRENPDADPALAGRNMTPPEAGISPLDLQKLQGESTQILDMGAFQGERTMMSQRAINGELPSLADDDKGLHSAGTQILNRKGVGAQRDVKTGIINLKNLPKKPSAGGMRAAS